jgi:uncharacterized protein YkwD
MALGTLVLASGIFALSAPGQSLTQTPVTTKQLKPVSRVAQSTNTAAIEQSIFNQINRYRVSKGLRALTRDSRIDTQARIHSQNMASGKVPFGHQGFQQRVQATKISFRGAAENVAYNKGYSDPATQAVQGWLKSTGHRTNIEGNYNLTGIGVATNSKGEVYFTQIFIRTR